MAHEASQTEQSPLISRPYGPPQRRWHWWKPHEAHKPQTILLLIAAVVFFLSLAGSMYDVPSMRIMEDIICQRYYHYADRNGNEIDEGLCKIDEIQSELALVTGVLSMFETIPSLLFALPYGLLADRIGRRHVLVLSIAGMTISFAVRIIIFKFWQIFPLRLIWISPIFQVIGGGNNVSVAMLYSMIADVQPAEGRTTVFLRVLVASKTGGLLAPILSSSIMHFADSWIAIWISFVGSPFACCLLYLVVPETLKSREVPAIIPTSSPKSSTFTSRIKSKVQQTVVELKDSMVMSTPLILLILTFSINSFELAGPLTIQYISKRFDWPMADTNYLISIRALVEIITLFVFIPALSNLLSSSYIPTSFFSNSAKDLFLARTSILLHMVGALLMAGPAIGIVISGLLVFTLGAGLPSLCRSLVASLIDSEHTARIFTAISLVDTLGALSSGPLTASLFILGLKWKGGWLGLPYLSISVFCGIVAILLYCVKLSLISEESSENLEADLQEAEYEADL